MITSFSATESQSDNQGFNEYDILLIEDDLELHNHVKNALEIENLKVHSAYNGKEALTLLETFTPDCLILDINLPEINGWEVCKHFRIHQKNTPVLMLTAFTGLEDKVQGFSAGADDYLGKPFFMQELILRVQSLLKRSGKAKGSSIKDQMLVCGDLQLFTETGKVKRQGRDISLTKREYELLHKLVSAKGEWVSKKDLLKHVWGMSVDANTNTVEVYVNFLRNKIDKPFGKDSIKTKVGFGYYFENP
jgi:DNA-binding response OmpR family regulator